MISLEEFITRNDGWKCTFCEPVTGWPGRWCVIWRSESYGKIGNSFGNRGRPTAKTINKFLIAELTARYKSRMYCDAKRAAGFKYVGEPTSGGNYFV